MAPPRATDRTGERTGRLAALAAPGIALGSLIAACGDPSDLAPTRSTRAAIVDGEPVSDDGVGATVALVHRSGGSAACSGALIAGDRVATAAHCVAGKDVADLSVVAGAADVAAASSEQVHRVEVVEVHPDFPGPPSADPSSLGSRYDVAVLRLDRAVEGSMPVAIPTRERAGELLVPHAPLAIAGYGASDRAGTSGVGVLRRASVTIERIGADEMLAGGDAGDTCYGDSGGPAYAYTAGRQWLAGITSRSRQDAPSPCGAGTIFEIASSHGEFLEGAGADALEANALGAGAGSCSFRAARPPAPAWQVLSATLAAALLQRAARRDQDRRRRR